MVQPQHSPHPRAIVPQLASERKASAVDNGKRGTVSCLFKAAANLVAHLFAEFLAALRSFLFGDIEPIEDVKILDNRVTIARHGKDTQQFGGRPARAADFPTANGVGAARREAAKFGHVSSGQLSADRIAEILANLLEFGAGHGV